MLNKDDLKSYNKTLFEDLEYIVKDSFRELQCNQCEFQTNDFFKNERCNDCFTKILFEKLKLNKLCFFEL